jgi:hypothetical protein
MPTLHEASIETRTIIYLPRFTIEKVSNRNFVACFLIHNLKCDKYLSCKHLNFQQFFSVKSNKMNSFSSRWNKNPIKASGIVMKASEEEDLRALAGKIHDICIKSFGKACGEKTKKP